MVGRSAALDDGREVLSRLVKHGSGRLGFLLVDGLLPVQQAVGQAVVQVAHVGEVFVAGLSTRELDPDGELGKRDVFLYVLDFHPLDARDPDGVIAADELLAWFFTFWHGNKKAVRGRLCFVEDGQDFASVKDLLSTLTKKPR